MGVEHTYEFVLRGLLTEEALDRAGRQSRQLIDTSADEIAEALHFELLDPDDIDVGRLMGVVYSAITAFERSARRFVAKVLQGEHGDAWWDDKVSERIRKFAESRRAEEEKVKWHGTRGDDPLTYTEMSHLVNIIQQNWEDFEPHIRRLDWVTSTFGTIERSRNVIMHSGVLDIEDVERVGITIRDWVKQVGT